MQLDNTRCLVVGAGGMGQAHLAALNDLIPGGCAALATSERNAAAVREIGAEFFSNGIADAISRFNPTHAVVASPVELLSEHAGRLIDGGVRHVLVEKPAALNQRGANALQAKAAQAGAQVWVAYNRRFYGPVRTARDMIEKSGETITSVMFEFTEWSHVIAGLDNQSAETKAHWLLANSMHVIDGALHPVGLPNLEASTLVYNGALDWHPSASVFAGAGFTEAGVPFSYAANWDAPGRWGFEWLTPSTRYIFRPMEKLHVTRKGSVTIEEVPLLDDLDERFKPGVHLQDRAFLTGEGADQLVTLREAGELIALAQLMGGYASE